MGMRVKRQVSKKPTKRYKYNNATQKGHIHKHKKTWLPETRIAKTHAWYRRHNQIPPTRRKKELGYEQRTSNRSKSSRN